jgi:uncharacterized protein
MLGDISFATGTSVKQYSNGYIGNRVLKMNVGFLLSSGPGHSHDTVFDVPAVRVAPDVDLAYIRGPLRLSRTKEGILVQGNLHIGLEGECYRCLDPMQRDIDIRVEELYTYPPNSASEFSIDEDAILDIAPLVREEAIIADASRELCSPDCKGICPNCGANLNRETCDCEQVDVDPRLAKLKQLLDK